MKVQSKQGTMVGGQFKRMVGLVKQCLYKATGSAQPISNTTTRYDESDEAESDRDSGVQQTSNRDLCA